ncbi:MAG: Bug family tripartite tricarboxylate transporter substrate binding protein [Beijerinckiaceae bacterium]
MKRFGWFMPCAATAALFCGPALAQDASKFFADKTLTYYVGLSAGGGYDQNARLVARYINKYIPGAPQVIVRNMPGGGGLVMTNFVAGVAPKDGLHIAVPQRGVPFEPLLGSDSHAKFDPLKLQWIGSTNSDTSVALVHKRTGVKTWRDLREKEVVVGGTGVGTESVTVPYLLRNLLGFRYSVIAGYPGGSDVNLAMERGEVDGRGTFSWTSLKPKKKEWLDTGEYVILYQMALRPHKELQNVPLVTDLAPDAETKALLRLQFAAFEMGRPQFVADGVPADRVEILRRAFDKAMEDKALIAEAEKADMEIDPMTGEEMTKLMQEVYSSPKEVVARLSEALKKPNNVKLAPGAKK